MVEAVLFEHEERKDGSRCMGVWNPPTSVIEAVVKDEANRDEANRAFGKFLGAREFGPFRAKFGTLKKIPNWHSALFVSHTHTMDGDALLPWAIEEVVPKGVVKLMDGTTVMTIEHVHHELLNALQPHMDTLAVENCFDPVTDEQRYSYVYRQKGSGGGFHGWAVQIQVGSELCRLALVSSTRLGALLAAAARRDPRLRTRTSAVSWLMTMVENEQVRTQWLADLAGNFV